MKRPRTMQRIYLAGRFDRGPELREHAITLNTMGFTVTSRWLWGEHACDAECTPEQLERFAKDDVVDVLKADIFVGFTEDRATAGYQSGGRHVELGLAICGGVKSIAIVGPKENVFHHLPIVHQFDTFAAWSRWIDEVAS